jgi:HSP20 family molecular chaperone IbpA
MESTLLLERTFVPAPRETEGPVWSPPIDLLETDEELVVLTAMPGVDPDDIEVVIQDDVLTIAGHRQAPRELAAAFVHRLELPQGRFMRRIALPSGRYRAPHRANVNNCLIIRLSKI